MKIKKRITIMRVLLREHDPRVEITRVQNLIGKRFGRLTVTRFQKRLRYEYYWECVCDCGQLCAIQECNLITGNSKSCGCIRRETAGTWSITHGMSRTRIYSVWKNMIRRCESPRHPRYADYGGREIRVCKRWYKFENFYADMGDRPTPAHSLDRVDNDGNYCKENCRWATQQDQARNRRRVV